MRSNRLNSNAVALTLAVALGASPGTALAFGKKPSKPKTPTETQAFPTRVVHLGKFSESPFKLPGSEVPIEIGSTLPDVVITEMAAGAREFRPGGKVEDGQPLPKFVLRGGLTSFEASAFSGRVKFGFKTGVGDVGNGIPIGVDGEVKFNVGSFTMDLHVIDTESNMVVAAARGDALIGGVGAEINLDIAMIKTGADFVFNPQLNPLFRFAIRNALGKMIKDPNTNFFMDWKALVGRVDPVAKRVYISAGEIQNIKRDNIFTVYDGQLNRLGDILVENVLRTESACRVKNDPNDEVLNQVRVQDEVRILYLRR